MQLSGRIYLGSTPELPPSPKRQTRVYHFSSYTCLDLARIQIAPTYNYVHNQKLNINKDHKTSERSFRICLLTIKTFVDSTLKYVPNSFIFLYFNYSLTSPSLQYHFSCLYYFSACLTGRSVSSLAPLQFFFFFTEHPE